MKTKDIIRRLKFIESVLCGVMPTGNYSGQRRQRQNERIDEAIVAAQEISEHVIFMATELSGEADVLRARLKNGEA